jgi:hypothetical protein
LYNIVPTGGFVRTFIAYIRKGSQIQDVQISSLGFHQDIFQRGDSQFSMVEPENLLTNLMIKPLNTVFTDCLGVYRIEE